VFSPLEKFDIISLLKIGTLGYFDLSITNFFVYLFLSFFLIIAAFYLFSRKSTLVPNIWQIFSEVSYRFISSLMLQQAGFKSAPFLPFLFLVFFFILFANYLGLTPFSFTVTSHIALTFFISFTIWFSFLFLGFLEHGLGFLKLFIPNVPKILLPFLILIEIVSYVIRAFSLAIRLSANMTAGHTLVHILSGFSVQIMNFSWFLVIFPFLLVLAILTLEFGIAFLQAYVFTTLACIYLNDSLNLH